MRPAIYTKELSDTLSISRRHRSADYAEGYWLYDSTRGMNLAIGSKTWAEAFVKAIHYYQKRLSEIESRYKELDSKVQTFISSIDKEEHGL
jgi:hypothetical protein